MAKDPNTLTPRTKTPDPYWIEVRRLAAAIAAHPKLNSTAKFVGVWLLFNYASREKFLAESTLQVWPSVATLARQCGLSTDQVDAALASLEEVGAMALMSRGRGRNNSSKRVFSPAFVGSVSPNPLGDNSAKPDSYHRVHSDISPNPLGDTPTLSPRELGTTYRILKNDNPPDARASGAPGGVDFGAEEKKAAEQTEAAEPVAAAVEPPPPKVPRQQSKTSPRQPKKSVSTTIADADLKEFTETLTAIRFLSSPTIQSVPRVLAYRYRRFREAGYQHDEIMRVVRGLADDARSRYQRNQGPRKFPSEEHFTKEIAQRREKKTHKIETAQRVAAEHTSYLEEQKTKEAARVEYLSVLRPLEVAFLEHEGWPIDDAKIDRRLSDHFDDLCHVVIDLKTGTPVEIRTWGEFDSWKKDPSAPQKVTEVVEAAKRFALGHPNERPTVETIGSILAGVVNARLEYARTKPATR